MQTSIFWNVGLEREQTLDADIHIRNVVFERGKKI
jgi:hypothetical protein